MGEALSSLDDGKSHGEGSADGPSDGVLLSQLIQLLSRRPKQSLLLSDLAALLPGSLRHRAKEKGGLGQWIQMYGSLFRIDGQPGKEAVILTIQSMGGDPNLESTEQAGYPLPPGFSPQEDVAMLHGGHAQAYMGGEELLAAPGLEGEADHCGNAFAVPFDEEAEGHLAVQLRGLPYKATVEDVRAFLGAHTANLNEENSVHLVLNRDGRPSGFARVVFSCPEAARTCRDDLHLRGMDDRYVEVFLYPERPSKGRSRRIEDGSAAERALTLADAAGVTKEQVVRECRNEMSAPGKRRMLLSMLGVTLSQGSRAYLKQIDQGLKHFLAQFPVEFSVEGAKGCEYVTYSPIHLSEALSSGPVVPGFQRASGSTGPAPGGPCSSYEGKVPTSPKPCKSPAPQDGLASAGRGLATPSNWGTPAPGHGDGGQWNMLNAPWNVPPWPGISGAGGAAHADGAAGESGEDGNGWGVTPSWPCMQPSTSSSSMMQWPGNVQSWNNASTFNSWGDPASASAFDQMAATAHQNAAAAAALGSLGALGLDPAGLAALASAYGAAAAAVAAGGGAPAMQPPGPVAPQLGPCASMAQQNQQHQGQPHSAAAANSGGYPVESGVAAIRLRGLPFTSNEQDVLAFFAQHDVVDRISDGPKAVNLLTRSNGRSSGQAVVHMRDRTDAELAQRVLNGQWMGNRYIEVFLHGDETSEPQNALAAATAAVTAAQNAPGGAQPPGKQAAASAAPNGAAATGNATPLSLAGNLMQGQACSGQGGEATRPAATPDSAALAGSQEFMAQYASMQAAAWQQHQNLWQSLPGGAPMMPGLGAPGTNPGAACSGSGTHGSDWQALFSFLGDGSGGPPNGVQGSPGGASPALDGNAPAYAPSTAASGEGTSSTTATAV